LLDVSVVAGDIADDLRIIDWTLRKLRSLFGVSAREGMFERAFEADLGL